MYRNFELDTEGLVAASLMYDPGTYISDRFQELHGTRYGMIIDETAEIAIAGPKTIQNRFRTLAFTAGAAVTLEALEYADLPKFKKEYIRHSILCRGLPQELRKQDPEEVKEQIEYTALLGHASHPELQAITDRIGEYYVETTQIPEMKEPVSLGVGRMAFTLDKCFGALRQIDPNFDIAQTLEENDWSSIEPGDITGEIR